MLVSAQTTPWLPRRHSSIAEGVDHHELDESQTLQNGVFGVLYTLLSRRFDNSKRLAAIRLSLEFLQVFTLIVSPLYGWTINRDIW
jgi:hypothetical protein